MDVSGMRDSHVFDQEKSTKPFGNNKDSRISANDSLKGKMSHYETH
jgi:hypothetical protein